MPDASKSLPVLSGGCLCGRVRYEATPDHREGYYCHCRMCQLATGNTRAAFLNLRKAELRWLSQPTYYASSKIARRGFCSHCGTPLSFDYLDSERLDITVGSLDDPSVLKPTTHFSVETRIASWHAEDGLPGQRLDSNESIMKRWRAAYGDATPGLDTARGG
ncbi:MAG TPA: GFA family protein [Burkholderiaceae bacterium]|nr:GFA family protein [Burkholderiaceae bacterium]